MKKIYKPLISWVIALLVTLLSTPLFAAYFNFLPTTVTNPDGTTLECFASGDEFFNWLHDADGFTIIQSQTDGYFYFAAENRGQLVASQHRAGRANPRGLGMRPWLKISQAEYAAKRDAMDKFNIQPSPVEMAAKTGELNNLVVYIRFADETEFTNTRTLYDTRFSAPTGSLKSYFYEVSYNKLTINSTHYPICDLTTNLSYQDSKVRNYYRPYNATTNPIGYANDTERTSREHQLLVDAVNYISSQVPTTLNIDNDNNGLVDNVCFIIKGNSDGWAELLWAHRWSLYSKTVYINGKRVYDYTFQPENQNSVTTLCHEMFHVIGAPDLYHYTSNGITPVGSWDLMQSGSGHMGAYMKWKYSGYTWIENIPEITASGNYTLNPLTSSTNNVYKIKSPNSASEFFIVEYRKKTTGSFETTLPGEGLLVYRINPAYRGNANGPPDEVYIYRPNGTLTNNGTIGSAHYSSGVSRTAINDATNPAPFLTNGSAGGLNISNVGTAGTTISFQVNLITLPPVANFTASKTAVATGQTVTFTDLSTNDPTAWAWTFEGGTPSASTDKNPVVTYSNIGTYSVSLTATNIGGSGTKTMTGYITVSDPAYCASKGYAVEEWIASVAHTSYTQNSGSSGTAGYQDFTSTPFTVTSGTTASFTLTPGFTGKAKGEYWRIWVDYNGDKDFDDAGELVYSSSRATSKVTASFAIPTGLDRSTRMRVSMKRGALPTQCETFAQGEVEDYTLTIRPQDLTPLVASFSATPTTLDQGGSVAFTDLSSGNPTGWSWSFPGGTPSTSSEQHPTVTYNMAGTYNVSLTISKPGVSNASLTQSGYITVNEVIGGTYCEPVAVNSGTDFIKQVSITGLFSVSSGGSGFAFDPTERSVTPGQSYTVSLTPNTTTSRNYWKIWVDANGDGDFTDAGETLLTMNNRKGAFSGSIAIPSTLVAKTRMRISMRIGASPLPCDDNFKGEVEDYTLVSGSAAVALKSGLFDIRTEEITNSFIRLYPNPMRDRITLEISELSTEANFELYDIRGTLLQKAPVSTLRTELDLTALPAGIYVVAVRNGEMVLREKVLKTR